MHDAIALQPRATLIDGGLYAESLLIFLRKASHMCETPTPGNLGDGGHRGCSMLQFASNTVEPDEVKIKPGRGVKESTEIDL